MQTERPDSRLDSEIDLSALAWVHDELRRSLESAHKALRRFVKEYQTVFDSDVDAVDPAVLRGARQQLHQSVGALELVGLPAAARVLRATESMVQRFVAKPQRISEQVVDAIERASFALLDYVGRMLAGKSVSALSLFPQYRALQELAGVERVHPADLWIDDGRGVEVPADATAAPVLADRVAQHALEQQLLKLLRGSGRTRQRAAFERIGDLCAGLGAGAPRPQIALPWQLAAAMFEALARGLLELDVYGKRVVSRLLPQFRLLEAGQTEVSDRLVHELLFFCAQADSPGDGRHAPRLAAVRQACRLTHHAPADYDKSVLGRFDPALIAQARKRVAGAKEAWGAVAGGETHRWAGLGEQFSLVGDSLRRLYPNGQLLADELQAAVNQAQHEAAAPPAALAMEVATSLLYLDASLEDADFDGARQQERVQRLAERVAAVREGRPPQALEAWMEELYRRVSDRQTLGSVVHELRVSLSESEKLIDQYFRHPADPQVLMPVPNQLSAMRGVLSVLGLEQASQAALRMRDDIDALLATEVDPARAAQAGTFDRLAGNLGALGFLIDMFSVQPQMAKSLFAFDSELGTLSPAMGRAQPPASPSEPVAATVAPRLIEQAQALAFNAARQDVAQTELARDLATLSQQARAAEQPGLVAAVCTAQEALETALDDAAVRAAREQLSEALVDFVHTASEPGGLEPTAGEAPAGAVAQASLHDEAGPDEEMREVFLDEAAEVLEGARAALSGLGREPAELAHVATLRRAFHTLKGSARMVGLSEFAAAAWACEEVYNDRLAEQRPADPPLLDFTSSALAELARWVEAIARSSPLATFQASPLQAAADALQAVAPSWQERPEAMAGATEAAGDEAGQVPEGEAAALLVLPPDLPSAQDLEFGLELEPEPETMAPPVDAVAPAPDAGELSFELDLGALDESIAAEPATADGPVPQVAPAEVPAEELAGGPGSAEDDEQIKRVGELRIGIPLFNIYLNEADELSRRLGTELAEWAMELHRPVGESAAALAHSLAGSSATVGFADLSRLSRALEHGLLRSNERGQGDVDEARLYVDVAEEIRRLLHQFAAGFLKTPQPGLIERLAEHEVEADRRLQAQAEAAVVESAPEPATEPAAAVPFEPVGADSRVLEEPSERDAATSQFGPFGLSELKPLADLPAIAAVAPHDEADDGDDAVDAIDAVDAELFPIFEEEGRELLPQLAASLRHWMHAPTDPAAPAAAMRALHTLKGGARLAGAMRLGEMCHRLESRIEHLLATASAQAADVEALLARSDALAVSFEALSSGGAQADAPQPQTAAPAAALLPEPVPRAPVSGEAESTALAAGPAPAPAEPDTLAPAPAAPASEGEPPEIDWSRFAETAPVPQGADRAIAPAAQAAVRVRAPLLDRMVSQAGEVSIARTRIEAQMGSIKVSLDDLGENLERLRQQLRELELQGETQMSSRLEAAKAAAQTFDPLEFDRYTRFQEVTRMMAESVNDVATVQRTLQRAVASSEDELAAQTRLTRSLQDDLLRTRMVEFESQADRLYRVVRQAAKETGKQVRLDIVGGSIEVDRGVLDRMTAAFEHLLRNCVTHGIEPAEVRRAAGKDPVGAIVIALQHEGNEVAIEFRDDGGGLDLPRIRDKAVSLGLIDAVTPHGDAELANLIFTAGFSTAGKVTELAGRGVGMDVVRSDVAAMGGRIETATAAGKGTSFKLVLPLTTAITQVVMLRCGDSSAAVPSTLVEVVQRATSEQIDRAYASGSFALGDRSLPFYWLGALLQQSARSGEGGRARSVVVIHSAQQRVALHVDEVLGNQEAIVKNLGPQLSRLPGLAGMTLLASGEVALIYNPVALAALYGEAAHAMMRAGNDLSQRAATAAALAANAAPLVLVVDDSLTVRRVTQRLLAREGYRVALAKDGLDALEQIAEEKPKVVLSDIEMPRMDGFDLVRNLRADPRFADLPVIMITSRIAQKHRDVAAEIGVEHYLGKPYSEEDLLALIGRYAMPAVSA
jgi:chemosensory pili system protein ChpA (sensor histidine kinase/response regulator)